MSLIFNNLCYDRFMKNKNYKLYYIFGFITLLIGILGITFGLYLPLRFVNNKTAGWWGVALTALSIVLCFYSFYLIKKAKFIKLNIKDKNKTNENNPK